MIAFKADAPKYNESVLWVIKHNAQIIHEIIDSDTTKLEWKFIRDFWKYLVENDIFDENEIKQMRNNYDIRWCFHHTLLKLTMKGVYTWSLNYNPTSP
jgi:hypothetical protein